MRLNTVTCVVCTREVPGELAFQISGTVHIVCDRCKADILRLQWREIEATGRPIEEIFVPYWLVVQDAGYAQDFKAAAIRSAVRYNREHRRADAVNQP